MGWRHIEVDGRKYRWRGKKFFIIQDEEGKRVAGAAGWLIKDVHPDTFANGQWDGHQLGMITPKDIADYLRKVLNPDLPAETQ